MKSLVRVFLVSLFLLFSAIIFNGCAARVVYVATPPPAARVEVRPVSPYAGAVWVPGHWAWRRGHHVWVNGHWIRPRKGHVWVPGHWDKRPRGWVWVEGHWRRG